MKNLIPLAVFLCSVLCCNAQLLEKYSAVPSRCETEWTGAAAFSSYELTGTIPLNYGEIILKDGWIQACVIEFNVKGISHEEKDLVTHLKSVDFFDVKNYPTAQFNLTEPCEIINGVTIAVGELTIKDHIKAEQFEVKIQLLGEKLICTFMGVINRLEYGVNHNSPSLFEDLKDEAIADDFTLKSILHFQLAD